MANNELSVDLRGLKIIDKVLSLSEARRRQAAVAEYNGTVVRQAQAHLAILAIEEAATIEPPFRDDSPVNPGEAPTRLLYLDDQTYWALHGIWTTLRLRDSVRAP